MSQNKVETAGQLLAWEEESTRMTKLKPLDGQVDLTQVAKELNVWLTDQRFA
jgi:hypothetical protein